VHNCIISLRGEIWSHNTSLTPPLLTEVPVPNQDSEQSYIVCCRGYRFWLFLWFFYWILELFRQLYFMFFTLLYAHCFSFYCMLTAFHSITCLLLFILLHAYCFSFYCMLTAFHSIVCSLLFILLYAYCFSFYCMLTAFHSIVCSQYILNFILENLTLRVFAMIIFFTFKTIYSHSLTKCSN
jgi:hypothetical protein